MKVSRRELISTAAAAAAPARPAGRNPLPRVVTVSQDGLPGKSEGEIVEATLARLNDAASFRPDIACLPELAVRAAGLERFAAWARSHSCHLIAGAKAGRYNSAVLLDRQGRMLGRYDKMHPTEPELAAGTEPGRTDPSVFQTEFGAIGIQICFDVNWWDNWKRLKDKGARVIFFPSAYPAARQISMLALMNECYLVSSTQRGPSAIYDITGVTLASSGHRQQWAAAVLPLGRRLFETDFHTEKARRIQGKYGPRIDLTWYHDDDWFTLASLDPELTVEDIIAEFGLTPLSDYRRRAGAAVAAARSTGA